MLVIIAYERLYRETGYSRLAWATQKGEALFQQIKEQTTKKIPYGDNLLLTGTLKGQLAFLRT